MFKGSENFSDGIFDAFKEMGTTNMNGTTFLDRTNYYETIPTPGLERVLWLESDRMGHLLGAVTQKALDDERGVVQNEKRQGDNKPYGMTRYRVSQGVYPENHPYYHSTIGAMVDLNAASLDDVHAWFKKYYGAANAVIALSGDIDVKTARPLMEKYFGDIPAGEPQHFMTAWVPERKLNSHETMYDNVNQTRIQRAWAVPGRTTRAVSLLGIGASVLAGGKNSRLYKELVEKRKLVTSVSASISEHELASMFTSSASLNPGVDPVEVEQVIEDILAELLGGHNLSLKG